MKWNRLFLVLLVLLSLNLLSLVAQEAAPVEKKGLMASVNYDPAGRRDPFKNLLGGKEVKEKTVIGGIADISIDDVQLIGVTKTKGKLEAIISLTKGFPLILKEGDKLSDGYVLSIRENQVVFRKTEDKGIPLMKPRDVIREIIEEE